MVFSAEWKRPSGAVAVTPWHKYVQSLLCKYGVDVEVAGDRACACKKHISSQVGKLHADRIESLRHSTLPKLGAVTLRMCTLHMQIPCVSSGLSQFCVLVRQCVVLSC
jgi:hypothetical protein